MYFKNMEHLVGLPAADDPDNVSVYVCQQKGVGPAACKHLAETSDSRKPRSGPRILTLVRISLVIVIAATVTDLALKTGQFTRNPVQFTIKLKWVIKKFVP